MMARGHVGLALALYSLFLALYPGRLSDMYVFILMMVYVGFATLPDIDIRLLVKHRGVTHSLVGAVLSGLFGLAITYPAYPNRLDYALVSFAGGFAATLTHMLGDVFTYSKFKPLYPLSHKEVALGLFASSDPRVNNILARAGLSAFTVAFMHKAMVDTGVYENIPLGAALLWAVTLGAVGAVLSGQSPRAVSSRLLKAVELAPNPPTARRARSADDYFKRVDDYYRSIERSLNNYYRSVERSLSDYYRSFESSFSGSTGGRKRRKRK
ncbi:metal-dependent hydrolase [Infirmifilum lucidum]|nr:metal-dependent hydrolase [Infirmifilum lucidum]